MDNPVCDICGGKLVEIKPKITKDLYMFHLNCMLKKLLFISMSVMNAANGKKQCISFRKKDM